MNRPLAWMTVVVWSLMALQSCTHMDTRLVSPDIARPYYELRGPDLLALQLEAGRVCPAGYDITRQWERQRRVEGQGFVSRWWNKATAILDDEDRQAEMTIACRTAKP